MTFFGDAAWFYLSARDALLSGYLPLLGITASLTWLHQGAVWTYLIMPGFILSDFHPFSAGVLTTVFNLFAIVLLCLVFRKSKSRLLAIVLFLFNPYASVYLTLPYHTSPLPLFTLLCLILILKSRYFMAGIFLGLLYQLHLLTFIFWLPALITGKRKLLAGFLVAIIPFLISGPLQTLGAPIWFIRRLLVGFSGVSLLSEAYIMVLLIPALLVVTWLLSHLPKLLLIPSLVIILLGFGSWDLKRASTLEDRIMMSRYLLDQSITDRPGFAAIGPGSHFRSSTMPYEYLVWWLSRSTPPTGTHHLFLINDSQATYSILE